MAHGKLDREVLEGLARAAGVDLNVVSVDTLLRGDLPLVWEGIRKFDEMDVQFQMPAFVSRVEVDVDEE